jgi:hypothetical protein
MDKVAESSREQIQVIAFHAGVAALGTLAFLDSSEADERFPSHPFHV